MANAALMPSISACVPFKVGGRLSQGGAKLIAHAVHPVPKLLQGVRKLAGQPIPLAWDRERGPGTQAIEVYPGAALKAYLGKLPKYKDKQAARRKLLDFLAGHLRLPEDTSTMEENDNALDAGLCVLAAVDFLRGNVRDPEDGQMMQKAPKEGWIWVRG